MRELFKREIPPVKAPDQLWGRIHQGLNAPSKSEPSNRAWQPVWVVAAVSLLIVVLVPSNWLRQLTSVAVRAGYASDRVRDLDLSTYLAPVQRASISTSLPALYQAPPHFQALADHSEPVSLAGYEVAVQREAIIDGVPVRQMVLRSTDNTVAVFVAPPSVRVNAGGNRWVSDNILGQECKQLNCPHVRTVQFPCSRQTCVLVCKSCSRQVLASLTEALSGSVSFR